MIGFELDYRYHSTNNYFGSGTARKAKEIGPEGKADADHGTDGWCSWRDLVCDQFDRPRSYPPQSPDLDEDDHRCRSRLRGLSGMGVDRLDGFATPLAQAMAAPTALADQRLDRSKSNPLDPPCAC